MPKTNIFLTGATGVMGLAGLKELLKFPEEYNITVLARHSKKNKRLLKPFVGKGIRVIWGDLLDSDSIYEGVKDADIVLHVGGMVSPSADFYPRKTLEVNIGSVQNITQKIKEIESQDPDRIIKFVFIGSVSQYGSHVPPDHWKKVGDPLSSAKFDAYAVSKILAERFIMLSGIKKWVSLRQTGILHPGLLYKASNPVSFHVPMNGVLEWISVEDSGRLLERVCRKNLPDSFWNKVYNIGGGEKYRITNYQFVSKLLKALHCPPPEKIFEPYWFATGNFHGVWFEDSDYTDTILNFREGDSVDDCFKRMVNSLPAYFKLTPLVPAFLIKQFMKRVAQYPDLGTMWWIKNSKNEKIEAAWGSIENYKKIKDWNNLLSEAPDPVLKKSEEKGERILKDNSSQKSSESDNDYSSDYTLTEKICEKGHSYISSRILEQYGHSCPHCLSALLS